MKVSVNWLNEFVDISLSNKELVKKIGSQLGEVEATANLSKKYEGIVIARVVECKKHTNADKLNLCKIDNGKGTVQVVCGAPNVTVGQLVAWIPPGKIVPATFDKDPFVLEAREIRGELSQGMLASGHELDINDDHNGIVTLDKGKPGDDFAETYGLDDFIIDIENKMFTHRPDCFGILGVAREIAGIQGKKFESPGWYLDAIELKNQKAKDAELSLEVRNEIPKLVPRFTATTVSGVKVGPSPLWLQVELAKIGIKSINNIVDISNYVMMETSQPNHMWDYDKVKALSAKNQAVLVIRHPKKGEKLALLNNKTVQLNPEDMVVATDKTIVSLGGAIGGKETEVDASTRNIIIEAATWDMFTMRRTSMSHGIFTDAVTRFTKGQSPHQNAAVVNRLVELVSSVAGGQVAGDIQDKKAGLKENPSIQLDREFINSRLGLKLSVEQIVDILRNVEFKAEITRGSIIIVQAPFWRTDIEIAEDIVEEVGRLFGYDNLPLQLPKTTTSPAVIDEELTTKQWIRSRLASLGANEVLTYAFVHKNLLESAGHDVGLAFKLKNALSPELQYYRLSLMPSLIEKVHPNVKAGFNNFTLFETGKVHGKSEVGKDGIPTEMGRVAGILTGDYYQAKYLLKQLYPDNLSITYELPSKTVLASHKMASAMLAPFDDRRSSVAFIDGRPLGVVGEFKSSVHKKFKLPEKCAGFELFLSSITKSRQHVTSGYKPIAKYPSIDQDISLRTDFKTDYSKIKSALKDSLAKNSPDDVEVKVECIDIFAKDKKHKHTAFRLTANSNKRTLVSEVINKLLDNVEADMKKTINAQRV
ncbi:MAG: phenylalanine--tRNA ligase subunit beta [Candidatus Saccharimonadales bacterium]